MTIHHRYNNEDDDEDDEDDSTTVTTSTTLLFVRTFLMRVSQLIGLTPARSLLLHFLLIGYPFRYGLLPMGIRLPHNNISPQDPCSILFTTCMSSLEIKDPSLQYSFGLHAIVFYELVGVLWLLLQFRPTAAIVTFHQVLLGTSLLTLGLFYLGVSWLLFPLTDYMTTRIWMCYFTACVLSAWTVFTHPNLLWSGTVKWSIPANSIFYAAVIQLFMAIRGFQALLESNHAMEFHPDDEISTRTRLTLVNTGLGHYFMLLHAVLLLRIRTFLQVSQLRFICLYQLVVQLILLFWIPSQSSVGSLMLSISILIGYLNGFLWAGRAEGISRILSGEKED